MGYPFFTGAQEQRNEPVNLPHAKRQTFRDPSQYRAEQGLVDAVNVALLLGQPLLLTGEPGTGKSELANYLAWELNLEPVLKFETRSDSESSDLFYTYDALKRFQHAQSSVDSDSALPYINFEALGLAILRSLKRENVDDLVPEGEAFQGPKRSVVLIDEVDKAPRDFPNNILNEIDQLYFKIQEFENREVRADPSFQPIVIITSNSEKDLPAAFLRRCVFYDIPFPDEESMREILESRIGQGSNVHDEFFGDALDLFYELRKANVTKKPSTSELLEWISSMKVMSGDADNPLKADPEIAMKTASTLRKTQRDKQEFDYVIREWIQRYQEKQ